MERLFGVTRRLRSDAMELDLVAAGAMLTIERGLSSGRSNGRRSTACSGIRLARGRNGPCEDTNR
jgi:hypothetical protein